jgi:hypothetical protein
MEHAPYREMLEEASLNLLESAARRAFNDHLAVCQSCKTELTSYLATIALLVYAPKPVEPPPHLRARLLERISHLKEESAGQDLALL